MGPIVWVFLVAVVVLLPIKAVFLYWIFHDDIRAYLASRKQKATVPRCMYCQSQYTEPVDEGLTRWEGDELVLVTTYRCEHCQLPFWNVERVPMATARK